MLEWQTMDSAPRDGTNVDLRYVTAWPFERPIVSRITDAWWSEGSWLCIGDHGDVDPLDLRDTPHAKYEVTHWMRVPRMPETCLPQPELLCAKCGTRLFQAEWAVAGGRHYRVSAWGDCGGILEPIGSQS